MPATTVVPGLTQNSTYSQAVERAVVHKSAVSEVLPTGWRRTGEADFEVWAQWPRDHGYWRTRDGRQDPMLMVETARQILPLLSHAAYGMPHGHQLVWKTFSFETSAHFLRVTDRPAEITVRIAAAQGPKAGSRFRGAALEMVVEHEGENVGTVSTEYTAHPSEIYRRLRGPSTSPEEAMARARDVPLPPALSPASAGRELAREVVLSPGLAGSGPWQLRVDTTSPWLFDHPVDHAPGMLLMEAARQGAHAAALPRETVLTGIDVTFTRYVELDKPCWIEIAAPVAEGCDTFRVSVSQDGQEALSGTVRVADAPGTSAS
ncbi:ScbA/BarX family gamma-butyrolactone biosynthesis protein [Streptomyces sp. NPDC054796]